MSYRVRIESFEGPFDLLLYLVHRQKVDIGTISITEIADQYLAEISHLQQVDLDVASDFLVVASTLLEIKAASLLPHDEEALPVEYEDMSPYEMRDMLVNHLLEYKKFKNASQALQARYEAQARMHVRTCGPDRSVLHIVPDYLEDVTLQDIAKRCAQVFARQDVFLLESDHIAARVIPVETKVRSVFDQVKREANVSFSALLENEQEPAMIVVTFLAVLELFKRSMVSLEQDELFGDITVSYLEGADESLLDDDTFDSVLEPPRK